MGFALLRSRPSPFLRRSLVEGLRQRLTTSESELKHKIETMVSKTLHYRLALHGEFRQALAALVTDPLHAQNRKCTHFLSAWLPIESLWKIRTDLHSVNAHFLNRTSTYLAVGVTNNGLGQELDLGGGIAKIK